MVKTIKTRKILVDKHDINRIAEECGCRRVTVYNALRYACNSDTAKKVREVAKNKYGGKEVLMPQLCPIYY